MLRCCEQDEFIWFGWPFNVEEPGAICLPELLDLAVLWYRDVLVWKQVEEASLLTNRDRQDQITRLAGGYSDATLGARIEAVEAAKESLRRNVNPRLALEKLFLSFGEPTTAAR